MRKADPFPPIEGELEAISRLWGISPEEAKMLWEWQNDLCEFYEDDVYRVKVKAIPNQHPIKKQMMVRRRDLKPIKDHWKELQRIKNEVLGPNSEAVELYPAKDRTYDTSNTYHLWCSDLPFQFGYRLSRP